MKLIILPKDMCIVGCRGVKNSHRQHRNGEISVGNNILTLSKLRLRLCARKKYSPT